MEIYNYDPANGAFIGASEADPSPMDEGMFLIPAHATAIAPPACGKQEVAVFQNDAWEVKPDFRGVALYDTTTREKTIIAEIGVTPADRGLTDAKPLDTPCKWDAAKEQWVDDLDIIKKAKSAELNTACTEAITAGVESSALGATHTYPTKSVDQQNLTASVLLSLMPNLPASWSVTQICADSGTPPVWEHRPHTAAQIQQVATDVKAAIQLLRMKNDALQGKVASAKTADAVNAIAW